MKNISRIMTFVILAFAGLLVGCATEDHYNVHAQPFFKSVALITDQIVADINREPSEVYMRVISIRTNERNIQTYFGSTVGGILINSFPQINSSPQTSGSSRIVGADRLRHKEYNGIVYNIETYVLLPSAKKEADLTALPYTIATNWQALGIESSEKCSIDFRGGDPVNGKCIPVPVQVVHLGSGNTEPKPIGPTEDFTHFTYRLAHATLRTTVGVYDSKKAAVLILVTKARDGTVLSCESNWYFEAPKVLATSIHDYKLPTQSPWQFFEGLHQLH